MTGRRRVAGIHAAEAVLDHSPERLLTAWFDPQRATDGRVAALLQRLKALGVPTEATTRQRLNQLADGQIHQGLVLEIRAFAELGDAELRQVLTEPSEQRFFLVLDQVQDPHNLGACLRTADAAGVEGVIVPRDQAAGLTPVVAKVAAGAAETVPLYRVTNLARALESLKANGVWVVGAAGEADLSVFAADLTGPLALVIGAEGKGLRRLTRSGCDYLVHIPMRGRVESLNLSVAAGVLLYEAIRQREGAAHLQCSPGK